MIGKDWKVFCWLAVWLALFCGLFIGYTISDLQHERLHQEVRRRATVVELQLEALQDDLDEIVVMDYFIEETQKDLRKLGAAINRLIYTGPNGTMTIDHSLFRLSKED